MSSKCSSKVDWHCLADTALEIPNFGFFFLCFGSVPRHDGVAASKHTQRMRPKDEKAGGLFPAFPRKISVFLALVSEGTRGKTEHQQLLGGFRHQRTRGGAGERAEVWGCVREGK